MMNVTYERYKGWTLQRMSLYVTCSIDLLVYIRAEKQGSFLSALKNDSRNATKHGVTDFKGTVLYTSDPTRRPPASYGNRIQVIVENGASKW